MDSEFINTVRENLKECPRTVNLERDINGLYENPTRDNALTVAEGLAMLSIPSGVDLLEHCERLILTKQKEYKGASTDTFRNFRPVFGFEEGKSEEEILLGYAAKHAKSLLTALADFEPMHPHIWKEKAGDLFNYCWLLWEIGLIKVQKEKKQAGMKAFPRTH